MSSPSLSVLSVVQLAGQSLFPPYPEQISLPYTGKYGFRGGAIFEVKLEFRVQIKW